MVAVDGTESARRLLADPAPVIRPGWTFICRNADHLVEQVGGMQRVGDVTLNPSQVAEHFKGVIAGCAGTGALREHLQCTDKSRADVSAGSVDLTLWVGAGH